MDRQTALQLLAAHKPLLVGRFGIAQLALFGSTARDAAHQGSDIDVLVSFDGPASSAQYFGVLFYLEDVLGCAVDWSRRKHFEKKFAPTWSARPCMSEGASQREWRFYISDMIGFVNAFWRSQRERAEQNFPPMPCATTPQCVTLNSWAKPPPTYPNLFDGTTRRFLGAWSSPPGTS